MEIEATPGDVDAVSTEPVPQEESEGEENVPHAHRHELRKKRRRKGYYKNLAAGKNIKH
jgi:hypothetical protein